MCRLAKPKQGPINPTLVRSQSLPRCRRVPPNGRQPVPNTGVAATLRVRFLHPPPLFKQHRVFVMARHSTRPSSATASAVAEGRFISRADARSLGGRLKRAAMMSLICALEKTHRIDIHGDAHRFDDLHRRQPRPQISLNIHHLFRLHQQAFARLAAQQ